MKESFHRRRLSSCCGKNDEEANGYTRFHVREEKKNCIWEININNDDDDDDWHGTRVTARHLNFFV